MCMIVYFIPLTTNHLLVSDMCGLIWKVVFVSHHYGSLQVSSYSPYSYAHFGYGKYFSYYGKGIIHLGLTILLVSH